MNQGEAILLAELIRFGLTTAFTAMEASGMTPEEKEEMYRKSYEEFKKRKPSDLPDVEL